MTVTNTSRSRKPFELTGKHVLIGFVLFFGIILSSNVVMISLAVNTFPGLQSKSAYKAGRNYNAIIAQADQQKNLGWQVTVNLDKSSPRDRTIRLVVRDKFNNPMSDLSVSGTLQRTVHSFDDVPLSFEKHGAGVYTMVLDRQEHLGQWRLKIDASNRAGDTFQIEKKVYVAP